MKRRFLSVLVGVSTLLSTIGVPVTFQVDLGPRINTGDYDPTTDTVEVRGSFNDWSGGFTLARTNESSTIFSGRRDIAGNAGSPVEFKFVQVRDANVTWESTPNRPFSLPGTATALPVSYFNNAWEGAPVPVKFQVNMATQQAAGAFNPGAGDSVEARGSFNNWSSGFVLTPSGSNPDVYEGSADVPDAPGARVEYKFVISRAGGQVVWENDPNRAFTQASESQDLPVVYFNNITGVPVKAAIVFQVDMTAQIASGRFDTNSQEVFIRGNKMGWGNPPEGLQLAADANRPGVFTNIFQSNSQITGDLVEYKATIWTPDAQTTMWEDGANKALTFTGTEPTNSAGYHQVVVAPFYFNGVRPGELLDADTTVTFRVDMRNAHTADGTAFAPQNDTVSLNGSFFPNGWLPWGDRVDTQASNDGTTSGDTNAADGIYTVQVQLPRGTPARLEYKYGINGLDNEAAQGNNHVRYVRGSGSYVLPIDTFGTMTQETATADLGQIAINPAGGKITISWTGQPGARLQKLSTVNGTATDVAGSEGQSSYEVSTNDRMAFYRVARP